MADTGIKFGLQISFAHPPEHVVAQAVRAEQLGFDSVWLGEHFVRPAKLDPSYPYKEHQPLRLGEEMFDSMVTAGAIAASTRRISICTGVYLLPLRHPLAAARAIATAQNLSKQRLRVAVGLGWAHEEYEALGIPYRERGSRLDEGIAVLRKALAGGEFEHHGKHYSFERLAIVNQPVPLTLLVGGASEPAIRRAARAGDGWAAAPYTPLEECLAIRERIEAYRREYGNHQRPFEYFIRLPHATRASAENYAGLGWANITVGGGQIVKWTDPFERKIGYIEELAAELGVHPPGG